MAFGWAMGGGFEDGVNICMPSSPLLLDGAPIQINVVSPSHAHHGILAQQSAKEYFCGCRLPAGPVEELISKMRRPVNSAVCMTGDWGEARICSPFAGPEELMLPAASGSQFLGFR